ncbi:plexin domain-containing protein 2-like [Glandiceps talaboti]
MVILRSFEVMICWLVIFTGSLSAGAFNERSDSSRYFYLTEGQDRGTADLETVVMDTDEALLKRNRRENENENEDDVASTTLTIETVLFKDNHDYYKSTYITGQDAAMDWWVDLDSGDAKVQESLSSSERRAVNMKLDMEFLFYGHAINAATITTGGFIYVGPHIHPYLAATQYIAPLMANYDLSVTNHSHVRYVNKETSLTVEWNSVQLKDVADAGNFTFQVTIFNDSRIVFVYKEVPIDITNFPPSDHPVKVGVADAYYTDVYLQPKVIRRQINQYHAVVLDKTKVLSSSAIILEPLPTCNTFSDCESCEQSKIGFNCTWCPKLKLCSDGFDRNRQQWIDNDCHNRWTDSPCILTTTTTTAPTTQLHPSQKANDSESVTTVTSANKPTKPVVITHALPTTTTESVDTTTKAPSHIKPIVKGPVAPSSSGVSIRGVIVIVPIVIITPVIIAVVWICYAYWHPTTKSGLFLIQIQRSHSNRKNNRDVKYKYKPTVGISSIKEDIDI